MSTDLGVAYYYTNQADRAIKQFEHSLSVDPKHTKTLLNLGIVKAFGKQDLTGAAEAWQQVVALAPDSSGRQAARKRSKVCATRIRRRHRGRQPVARVGLLRSFLLLSSRVRARARALAAGGSCRASTGGPPAAALRSASPPPVKMVRDPVCGTYVVPGKALDSRAAARRSYFCSDEVPGARDWRRIMTAWLRMTGTKNKSAPTSSRVGPPVVGARLCRLQRRQHQRAPRRSAV